MSLRRVCLLVQHLPDHAAVWRVHAPDGGWTRTEVLLLAAERRITALWATVATAVGHKITEDDLAPPIPVTTSSAGPADEAGEAELVPLRDIARMMRS